MIRVYVNKYTVYIVSRSSMLRQKSCRIIWLALSTAFIYVFARCEQNNNKRRKKKKAQSTFKNDRYHLKITGFTQRFLVSKIRTNSGWIEN